MTPARRANLERLLTPRHVALVGGQDAVTVAGECARIGFDGPVWPVNPKRSEIAGHPCFASVADLPEAPDAVFLAVPREPAIETIAALRTMGAGGVVCYTAGFGEIGEADAETRLIAAAGDMALVGANCYGVINYVDRVALWPFAHGGSFPGYGAAIVTQSGMLSSDLTMSQRSVPLAYMISAGNQSVLRLEDYLSLMAGKPEVRAIGLHIEGLKDIAAFEAAAIEAAQAGKPVVALKTGSSAIGGRLTESHTGSLSGTDDLFNALFERLGIIRVTSPAQFLETLKFLCVAGVPTGRRIAGFTCSGGGATMLADHAEKIGLQLPQPDANTANALRKLLPDTATVSNPLDYTTPIWGMPDKTEPVFRTLVDAGHDAAIIVQDYPAPGLDESKHFYLNDAMSFVAASHMIPSAVCSTLPENMDQETRDGLVAQGVAPMQGIEEALNAMAHAAWHGERRNDLPPRARVIASLDDRPCRTLDEHTGKQMLKAAGLPVPDGTCVAGADAPAAAEQLGFPVALKMMGERLAHKSEAGAVRTGLGSSRDVQTDIEVMRQTVSERIPGGETDSFLVEKMAPAPIAELLVSIRRDPQFGDVMTLASGGVLVELVGDAATILLPASRTALANALDRLKVSRLMSGFRGQPPADRESLLDVLVQLVRFFGDQPDLIEIELNPVFALSQGCCIVDALVQKKI